MNPCELSVPYSTRITEDNTGGQRGTLGHLGMATQPSEKKNACATFTQRVYNLFLEKGLGRASMEPSPASSQTVSLRSMIN